MKIAEHLHDHINQSGSNSGNSTQSSPKRKDSPSDSPVMNRDGFDKDNLSQGFSAASISPKVSTPVSTSASSLGSPKSTETKRQTKVQAPALIDIKNFVFYPAIFCAIAWSLYAIAFDIAPFRRYLQTESPECMIPNEKRAPIFLATIAIFLLVQRPIETVSQQFFMHIIPTRKFPLGSDLRRGKAQMLGERVFKVIMNVLCVAVLYKILLQEDCDFFDVRLGGRTSHPLYFYNHPCQKIPANLDNFYLFKLAYHFYELGHTLVLDRKRVDFVEYALHHFLTFSLILFSYSVGYLPIGAAVMILHDVTDLGCSVFKLTIDITPTAVEVIGYIGMVVPWLYVRLWFFPAHVISRIFEEMNSWHGVRINRHMMIMLTVFLIVLFCMHIFWFYLMVKGLLRRFQAKTWKSGISFATNANNVE